MNIEIIHTPGTELKSSDYNSRNPESCNVERCQICRFANELQNVGDRIAKISVADINEGKIKMPFTQRTTWLKIQKNDKVHQQLSFLIDNSLAPEKRKTKGDNTLIKRLHNMYKVGKLVKAADGLITVINSDPGKGQSQAISIPSNMYPGLIQALHLKLDHPSKVQLQKLSARYFYSPGFARVIEEIATNCTVCASLKKLPQEIFSQSTERTETFGSNFSSDVLRMHNQKIFITREKLSQFTIANIIDDETAESLRQVLLQQVAQLIPDTGARIQVDCATGCQKLRAESESEGSIFQKLGIVIDLGRTLNINKNPVIENAIKEFHKEHLKINPAGGPVTKLELVLIMKNMNSRIRNRGLSSKEIMIQRDQVTHESKSVCDSDLADEQYEKRKQNHPAEFALPQQDFSVGDIVFLKSDLNKLKAREMYRIVELFQKNDEPCARLQKTEKQFRAKQYEAKLAEIFLVPGKTVSDQNMLEMELEEKVDEETMNAEEAEPSKRADELNNHEEPELYEDIEDKPEEDSPNLNKRKRRKAAMKCLKQTKNLISENLLHIKAPETKLPGHAWDWDLFASLMDEEVVYSIVKPTPGHIDEEIGTTENDTNKNTSIFSMTLQELETLAAPIGSSKDTRSKIDEESYQSELVEIGIKEFERSWTIAMDGDTTSEVEPAQDPRNESLLSMTFEEVNHLVQSNLTEKDEENSSLEWDDSPDQYDLEARHPEFDDLTDPIFQSTPLFDDQNQRNRLPAISDPSHERTLTSEDEDDAVFFHDLAYLDLSVTELRLRRANATRQKKFQDEAPYYPPHSLRTPAHPEQVQVDQRQILSQVLTLQHPIAAEAVTLGHDAPVQDVRYALDDVAEVGGEHEHEPRRSTRINYKTLHQYGRKESKGEGNQRR